jgi:adenylate kinase family enzyme
VTGPTAARLRVVGLPGAGKTSLARAAGRELGLPVLDLDAVMRIPGGRFATPEQYRRACREFLARSADGWVTDGDDVDEVGVRYDEADLVVWLDVPRWRCLLRIWRRAMVDLLTDTRAWHGAPEGWGFLVGRGPTADLTRWTAQHHRERTGRYRALAEADPARWLRLELRDVSAWLAVGARARPRRVRVLGSSGAGKTTLGRALAERLGVAHLELDSVYHLPGWQPATDDQVAASLAAFTSGPGRDGWVIDGNYSSIRAVGALEPDLVVWLDPPRRVQMARLLRRTVARAVLRRELWNGNRERPSSWLRTDPGENILRWGWTMQPVQRARFATQMAGDRAPWVRLRSARRARRWLRVQ